MFSASSFINSVSHIPHSSWLVDTGATHHVCCDSSLFTDYVPLHNTFVTLPNNQKVEIAKTGTVQLSPSFVLKSVLFVPSFSYNLLSVSSLISSANCDVHFTSNTCVFQDPSVGKMIGMGRRIGNLYVLDSSHQSSQHVIHSVVNSVLSFDV